MPMPPMNPGTGQNWVAAGPEDDVQAFVDGIEYLGSPPPVQADPQYSAYMRARSQFHDAVSIVPASTAVRESDNAGGALSNIGSASQVTSQAR